MSKSERQAQPSDRSAAGVLRRTVPTGRIAVALVLAVTLATSAPVHAGRPHRGAMESGQKAMARGDWDWAIVYFQRATDLKPDNPDYKSLLQRAKTQASYSHFELAKRHLFAGNLEAAIAELQQTVALNPSHQYAYVELEKAMTEWKKEQERKDVESGELGKLKEEAQEQTVGAVPKLNPRSNIPIQFALEDKTLQEIFNVIRDVSGINIIFDEGVRLDEKMSFVTDNVSLEEALELLMFQKGLAFKVYNDHTILVYPDNQTKQREYEDQLIRTFYLSNADVKDVNAILRQVIDIRKTAVNEKLNAITILDSQDKIAIAGKLIEANDKAKAELIIDLEILEVNRSKLKQYGIDIRSGQSAGIGSSIAFDDTQVRLNNLRRLTQLGSYVVTPIPSVILQLVRSDSDTRTLSRPQVRVTDNEQVTVHLGDQVPIPNTTFNTSNTVGGNVVPITSFTYQNVGIQITLEPRIHHNREITLKLQAEISSVGAVSTGGQPTIGTREVQTVIRLRDGESNLLAGLFQQQSKDALSGVPGTQNIPLIRRIFGATSRSDAETEIVLTVTPHIVRIPDISAADLAPLHVGTERNRRLRGTTLSGVGGSPFGPADQMPAEEPFTSLRPGAEAQDRDSIVVPDLDLATGRLSMPQGATSAGEPTTPGAATPGTGGEAESSVEEPAPQPEEPTPPPPPAGRTSSTPRGRAAGTAAPPPPSPAPSEAEPPAPPSPAAPPEPPPGRAPAEAGAVAPTGPVRLSFATSSREARVGESFTVEVHVDASGQELVHAPYHVIFDGTLAEVTSVTEGDFFRAAGANSVFIPNIQPGRVIVGHSEFNSSEAVTGTGTLAVLTLRARAPGDLTLSFDNAAPADRTNDRLQVKTDGLTVRIVP